MILTELDNSSMVLANDKAGNVATEWVHRHQHHDRASDHLQQQRND